MRMPDEQSILTDASDSSVYSERLVFAYALRLLADRAQPKAIRFVWRLVWLNLGCHRLPLACTWHLLLLFG